MLVRLTSGFILLLIFACAPSAPNSTKKAELTFTNLFSTEMNPEAACYRIPAIIKAQNGDLIAAIDERNGSCGDLRANKDINIVIRRSEDDGQTWSDIETIVDYPLGESASDPSMILDRETGELFLFFNYMDVENSPNDYFFQLVSSKDNGKSWSAPLDITSQISKPAWAHDFKFITSGRGIQTRGGTLLHTLVNLKNGLHVFGSNNHGKSWFLIDTPITPADESKIIELTNGSWMINSRVNKSGLRYVHTSTDQGESWTTKADSALIDPSCNASLIRYSSVRDGDDKNILLFCNANSSTARENLTLRLSYDEGKTWTNGTTIYAGKAAYADLCVLDNGDVGVFFEKDGYGENVFVRVGKLPSKHPNQDLIPHSLRNRNRRL